VVGSEADDNNDSIIGWTDNVIDGDERDSDGDQSATIGIMFKAGLKECMCNPDGEDLRGFCCGGSAAGFTA
jgi:hypothetical protein